jgi:hypothetical protein
MHELTEVIRPFSAPTAVESRAYREPRLKKNDPRADGQGPVH